MKQYKCVPGPKEIRAERNGSEAAVASFASIINNEAANGWEYHSIETITVVESPGCLRQPSPVNYYMLILSAMSDKNRITESGLPDFHMMALDAIKAAGRNDPRSSYYNRVLIRPAVHWKRVFLLIAGGIMCPAVVFGLFHILRFDKWK